MDQGSLRILHYVLVILVSLTVPLARDLLIISVLLVQEISSGYLVFASRIVVLAFIRNLKIAHMFKNVTLAIINVNRVTDPKIAIV